MSLANHKASLAEIGARQDVGTGWHQLRGGFGASGFSIEWHDFVAQHEVNWSKSFQPTGLAICLNVCGEAVIQLNRASLELGSHSVGFYGQKLSKLKAIRRVGQRHQFVTVEFALPFLKSQITTGLLPQLARFLNKRQTQDAAISTPMRLGTEHEEWARSLRHPPVHRAAQPLWYRAKALEIAAAVLYEPSSEEELFCQRIKRLNRERARKVASILVQELATPPSLLEIARQVGCSPFHLSRIFTQEMGQSITAYLRQLRLERAALLLRSGDCNVTEAAFEVGYSSLSHFTTAFRRMFGCCPGLYPLSAARKCAGEKP